MITERTGTNGGSRHSVVRIVVALSFVAAIWFILGDPDRRSSVAALGITGFASLFGLAVAGSALVAGSWAAVAGRHVGTREAFFEYLVYQPSKYLPGGVAQGLLQVSHVRSGLGSWGRASGVLVVHMGVLVGGGGLVALPALVVRFRALTVAVVYLGAVLIVAVALRATDRFEVSRDMIPPATALVVALLMAAAGLALWGIGYGGAMATLVGGDVELSRVSVFAASWMAGFLALPIPAGIGIREAALVALSVQSATVVVTASIVVRLAVAAAEFALALVALARGGGNDQPAAAGDKQI